LFRKYSDTAIVDGIRRQDDKILTWVYNNFFQSVRHHVLKNSGSEADVSDVFQETVITLYKQISGSELNLTTDLKGYFFGIAKNIWNSQLRKQKRTVELTLDLTDETENDEANAQILERIVSRAFQKLKPDAQIILTLYSEGKSYEEIVVRMNLINETYARRKKYLSKEMLLELIKADPEYKDYLDFQ
jgi:RNA polymerase sigma factor (sigma-70 family)